MRQLIIHGLALVVGIAVLAVVCGMRAGFLTLYLGIACVLLGLFLFISSFHLRTAKALYALMLVPVIVIACIHADNFSSYGPLLKETVDAIFQTSNAEALSYLAKFTSPWLVPAVVAGIVLAIATLWRIPAAPRTNPAVAAVLLLGGGALVYNARALPLMIYQTGEEYAQTLDEFSGNRETVLDRLGPLTTPFRGNLVVIIGESLSRHHMQIYGYPRKTTPYLASIEGELTIYRDAISTYSQTTESLSKALTFNRRGEDDAFVDLPDVLSVAGRAGLETWWLSNQNAVGVWDDVVSAMARQAQHVKYHDPASGMTRRRTVFDGAMVASLEDVLKQPNEGGRLIFLHTMATHFPYCGVVPQEFEPAELDYYDPVMDERFYGGLFGKLQKQMTEVQFTDWLVGDNCYDRAVSYVDSVVGRVMTLLRQQTEPTALLIVADHGEAPILGTGHEPRDHSHFHVEIPFILWMNDAYKSLRPDIETAPNRRISLADLSWTIADLAEITGLPKTRERSVVSPDYQEILRTTLNGRIGYDVFDTDADHVERARANLLALGDDASRVWAHRVDSAGKMLIAQEFFRGVEMDLVFDDGSGRFGVYHPPAPDVGLKLEEQLEEDTFGRRFWLDWKNANQANVGAALERLDNLSHRYDLKSRALVEISAVDGAAGKLTADGWQVSYYLPTERISACIESCSEEEAQALARELWRNFDTGGFSAVSFDAHLLLFVDKYMRDRIAAEKIPAYTWAVDVNIANRSAPEYLQPLLHRQWLKAILVTFPSYFHL